MSTVSSTALQYISDDQGNPSGVIVPIELWREISAQVEAALLLKSDSSRQQLLEATNRTGGVPLAAVLEELAAIRAFDEAKVSGDEALPFEQALDELERDRR